jgi:hypothetical protein
MGQQRAAQLAILQVGPDGQHAQVPGVVVLSEMSPSGSIQTQPSNGPLASSRRVSSTASGLSARSSA